MTKRLAVSIAALFLATAAHVGDAAAASSSKAVKVERSGVGQATGSQTSKVRAEVLAVDAASRRITLKDVDGQEMTFKVSPEVVRLDEIKAGDTVVLTYKQTVIFQHQPPGQKDADPSVTRVTELTAMDQAPGGIETTQFRGTVQVVAVDRQNRIVVVEGPGGRLHRVDAGPGLKLQKLKPGMKFFASYSETAAAAIEKAAAKAEPPAAK